MNTRTILNSDQFALTIDRLCYQLIENHKNFESTVLIGVQPRGVFMGERIVKRLQEISGLDNLLYGKLDITFYRDDFRTSDKPLTANDTSINFSIEGKRVVLIDDVLYTGRTIRAALDALLDYGRPRDVELMVFIDRRLQRHLPIQAKYVGKIVDSIKSEKVKVEWLEESGEDKISIMTPKNN
jgi:pyrimidine operon attenuation protein / uracil phosphoribosyltransferase